MRRASLVILCALIAAHSAGQNPDLPPRDAFLRETRDALSRSQQLWHRYAYKERRTELHTNPFGRMGMGGTRLTEVRPAADPRLTYRRIIERNGVAVSQPELDRQDAEHRTRVADVQRDIADADGDAATRREQDNLLAERRAQRVVADVVNALRFELERREMRDGRPAIVISFAGRPEARPSTREGRVARVFAGHIWVDEAAREVVHVEAVAKDDVSFGGFIAKIYEGTKGVVHRQEVEPGVWMPTRLTLTGEFRALFRRARIDHVVEWFDYRRLP
jgi:hypothetical protein